MTPDADIPKVSTEASVLDATNVMNARGTSAVAVVDAKRRVVGIFGERTLLTEFVRLDRRPDEVKVGEIMHALYKIKPDATTKQAAKEIVENGVTRLGVYDGEKFLGGVTLTDLARHFSRETLIDRLRTQNSPREHRGPLPELSQGIPAEGHQPGRKDREVAVPELRLRALVGGSL